MDSDERILKKPILFCIFNRLDVTKQSFECIRKIKPQKLYIACDGPRNFKEGEEEKVKEVIEYVEKKIDWYCQVHKNYSEVNLGCRERISSAISWALEHEDDIIIIEDDILPNEDFFEFCSEMLDYHKDDEEVMMVSGTNFVKKYSFKEPYIFASFPIIWGWATWKRAWKYYDDSMSDWPEVRKSRKLNYLASWPSRCFLYWNYKYVYNYEINSWGFVWYYTMHKMHGLGIVPRENLVSNCGFESEQSTHTKGKSKYDFSYGTANFPIEKNNNIVRDINYDKCYIDIDYSSKRALFVIFIKTVLFIPRKIKRIFQK